MRKFLILLSVVAFLLASIQPVQACNDPIQISVTANPYGGGGWTWTIEKTADQTSLELSPGQLFTVIYRVSVKASPTPSTYGVRGTVLVENVDPTNSATISQIGLGISPGSVFDFSNYELVPLTCPQMTIAPSSSITCTYDYGLGDASHRTVLAGVVAKVNEKTHSKSVEAAVDFTGAVTETDECIDVNDTNVGFLGKVCAGDAPKTFPYSLDFGDTPEADVLLECGENTHENIANFVTNDSRKTGQAGWTVTANVVCDSGCTLTQGYWKTHSKYGPAPYDSAWGGREDSTFFLSGQSWYNVFWTAPAGNPYYNLAHQYMAAYLNGANAASSPAEVSAAMSDTKAFFELYGPNIKWSRDQRATLTRLAGVLDSYNNGLIGPGHCSE